MTNLLKSLLSLSFSGTLLILVFFLFKPLWKNKLSKQWQYYIWLVVIARLLFPFTFGINFVGTIFRHLETNVIQVEQAILETDNILIEAEQAPINESSSIIEKKLPTAISQPLVQYKLSLSMCIFFIWLVIALILFVRKITIYQDFARYIKAGQELVDNIDVLNCFGVLLTETKIKKNIELTTNPLISSPLFMGIFRLCIVLPNIALVDTYFCYTIQHELTHYKRRDIFYKWLVQLVICIHWFNPFVYLMEREINRVCELSCDEVVIHHMNSEEKAAYGDTLINAIEGGNYKDSIASVTLNENKSLLKERLDSIMKYKKKSKLCILISTILTLTLCFGSAVTGAYTATDEIFNNISLKDNKEDNPDSIETIIIKNEAWYLISNETQLRAIGTGKYGLDKKYLQNADIQMSTTEWIPIGTKDNPFTGIYDGNGFEIEGLTMKDPNATVIGLFGFADNAILHNITMRDYDLLSAGSNVSQKGIAPILVYGNDTTKSYDNAVYMNEEIGTLGQVNPQEQLGKTSIEVDIARLSQSEQIVYGPFYLKAETKWGVDLNWEGNGMISVSCKKNTSYSGEQMVQQVKPLITRDFTVAEDGEYLFTISNQFAVSEKYQLEPYVSNLKGTIYIQDQININNVENLGVSNQKMTKELFNLEYGFSYAGKWTNSKEFSLDNSANINMSIDMNADKGTLYFYIKSLEDNSNQYLRTGNTNIKDTSIFLEAGKYRAIIEGDNLHSVSCKIKGSISENNNSNKIISKEPIQSINIDTISPNNLICIGKINLDKNSTYQCDITAESGGEFFVGLLTYSQVTSAKDIIFDQSYGVDGHIINAYFSADKPTTYYVYIINSGNSDIKNITGYLYLK